ncbi:MAG: leucine-rich repeat protein [Clostridia bacterium]|nr:leucine-rich repeat protein [Clostridia bacterium]
MKTKIFLAVVLALTLSLVLSVSIFANEDALLAEKQSTELYDANGNHLCTMTFDPETGRMTVESHYNGWWEWSPATAEVREFVTTYMKSAQNVVFTGKFGKIHVNAGGTYTFAGADNLVSVCFPKDARILDYSGAFNVFSGCTALTTVYFGNEADMKMGVIDFSGMRCDTDDSPTRFLKGMFKNCTSIKEVILPAFNNEMNSTGTTENNPTIFADTFEGCTNLRSITVSETFDIIENGAFDAAENLKTLNYRAPVSLITKDTFKGVHNGLIINVQRSDDVTVINNALAEGGVDQSSVVARVAALDSGWVVNGADGHTLPEKENVADWDCIGTLDTHAKTNIKWEVYNEGTAEAPSYTLYFSIDDDGYAAAFPEGTYTGNTVIYAYTLFENGDTHGFGWTGAGGGAKHPWVATTGIALSNFKKIVIGDGITQCNAGTFAGMTGVTVLEMPTSLTVFNGAVLKGCESLSTVYTRGQTPVEGVFNLSNIKNITTTNYSFCACKAVEHYIFADDAYMSQLNWATFANNTALKEITIPDGITKVGPSTFGGCTALEEVTLPASLTGDVQYKAFENCTALKKITIKGTPTIAYNSAATDKAGVTAANDANAFYNCPALETINAPAGSKAHQFAVKFGFETSHVAELYSDAGIHLCTMTYYPDTYKITIESHYSGWWEWTPRTEIVKNFVDTYMGLAKHVVFTGTFGKIHTRNHYSPNNAVFEGAENLISICFPGDTRVLDYSSQGGAFAGCTALTTIYFGNEADMKMGVIDFSGMRCDKDDAPTTFLKSMFSGCINITEVILPALDNGMNSNGKTDNNPTIYADTFAGCTKLVSITVPETYETIQNGAFDTCVNLKTLNYSAPVSLITKDTFGGVHSDLIIKVQSYDAVTSINAVLAEGGVAHSSVSAHYKQGMSITGYQVRTTGYNGLRTVFSFYDNAFGNYELVEVGSIVATSANFDKYAASFGEDNSILKLVDGKFVTPAENIIKTAIYSGGKFVNNYAKTDTGFKFSVTVTKFANESQYKAEVVNCGYEIWLTNDGTYYVVFTREETEGYETNSLYKMTFGMLNSGAITLEKSDNPVYNTLMDCGYETFSPTTDVEGYLFEDPLDSAKRIAVYLTDSSSPITLTESGLGTAVSNVSHMVFGKNVVLSLPEIDDYWVEHINEQLATLPEGRSFIAITDTHYQSGGYGNAGKSADLMQYVRQMTGIEKVINLGDPFHQENTYEGAKEQLSRSMEEKFFNYFGDDGMYAIGNHDSNLTMARNAEDLAIDPTGLNYKMDLLLSDKDIYDLTFAHIEEGGKKNGNIIYDEKLLSIIEANKSEVKEFVLDNVAPEDAGDTRMFGTVNYSAEEMYENLVCWAKMHYAYYDHEADICYIVLNTGGLTVTDFATLDLELWRFHPSQYEFLNTMLTDIATNHSDYDVVVAGHMFYDCDTAENSYNQNLFKMLSAFEGGTSVSFSASGNNALSGKLFGCTDASTSRTLSYDFTEISKDFTGEVFCITGHRHLDLHLVSQTKDEQYYMSVAYDTVADNLSDNAVQLILLNQDNYAESKSSAEGDNVQTMTKGTITEHSFTIFTITDNNTLVATRIGANSGWLQKEFKLG